MIKALWTYRNFIFGMVSREFKVHYMGSVLGCLWAVINPVFLIFVYTRIFSQVMKAKLPGIDDALAYSFFLCSGVFAWHYFVEVVRRNQTVFLEQANLMKKSRFPRVCLPAVVLLSASINFIIIFMLFMILLLATNRFPGWAIAGFLPLLLIQQAFGVGLGLFLGTLNVFFRDIGHAFNVILYFWFWLTPIVYPITVIDSFTKAVIMTVNPMAPLMLAYQKIILSGTMPDPASLLSSMFAACVFILAGYLVFRKLSPEMVDEL